MDALRGQIADLGDVLGPVLWVEGRLPAGSGERA
jgi:hypothetical protein